MPGVATPIRHAQDHNVLRLSVAEVEQVANRIAGPGQGA
jgi:hypothetical protein